MILSRLTVENQASAFAVPKMEITEREILYRSPVHFTPLAAHNLVDAPTLKKLIEKEYEAAGITREQVELSLTSAVTQVVTLQDMTDAAALSVSHWRMHTSSSICSTTTSRMLREFLLTRLSTHLSLTFLQTNK